MDRNSVRTGAQAAVDEQAVEALSAENPPAVIVFTNEQKEALRGTILEGSRGIRIVQGAGHLLAEQLA